jgi:copper chaperone CopZ
LLKAESCDKIRDGARCPNFKEVLFMEKASFAVPRLYADHHVQAVRGLLLEIPGVQEVYASSAFKRVVVTYDPAATSAQALETALHQAGYGPDDPLGLAQPPQGKEDGSFWYQLRPRVTVTNRLDIEMSGDFRKY